MKKYIIFKTKTGERYISGELINTNSMRFIIKLAGVNTDLVISLRSIQEALITTSPLYIQSYRSDGWLTLRNDQGFTLIGKSLRDIAIAYPTTLKGSMYASEKSIHTKNEPTMLPYALIEEIHDTAVEKGFWDKPRNEGELLMLVVSELAEALEALRNNAPRARIDDYKQAIDADGQPHAFKQFIKGSVDEEIADAVIRLFDIAVGLSIDLPEVIKAKMLYNETRERMHGKKF